MNVIGLILTVSGCIAVIYQDFCTRYVHIGALFTLAVGSIIGQFLNTGLSAHYIVLNAFFLGFLFGTLYLYLVFRYGLRKRIVDRYIGLGDIAILIILAIYYNLINYIFLILVGAVLALTFYALRAVVGRKVIRIPLAGCLAFTHLTISLLCFFVTFNPIETPIIAFP